MKRRSGKWIKSGMTALCLWLNQSVWVDAQTKAKADEPTPEKATHVSDAHEIKTTRYSLRGEKTGRVVFFDYYHKIYRGLQMDAGKWAREVFILDEGKTVGASQADHTVFWDAKTGKETGRVPEHVYGFSHDRKHFIAQDGHGKLSIYAYPGLNRLAQFDPPTRGGVSAFLFSPNDLYCAVEFQTCFPAPESTYPYSAGLKNIVETQLYCLNPVGEVPGFATRHPPMGTFAADSSAYLVGRMAHSVNRRQDGLWQFDLKTLEFRTAEPAKK